MIAWAISIALFISYTQTHVPEVLIASGLFAIAGSARRVYKIEKTN